jgi:hypothetical protein
MRVCLEGSKSQSQRMPDGVSGESDEDMREFRVEISKGDVMIK